MFDDIYHNSIYSIYETYFFQIECTLQRNHSPRKFATDQGYRLQQGFLISTLQQVCISYIDL